MSSTATQTTNTSSPPATLVLRPDIGAGSSAANAPSSSRSPRTRPVIRPTFASPNEEQKHVKERLAAAFRIFAKLGYDEGVAGHITIRDPIDPHTFWMNPYGRNFDLLCVSDLLRIDHQGNVLEGGQPGDGQIPNAAGFAIHGAIHAIRQDIHAAAHSHSIYGKTFSTLGRNLDIASHDAAAFSETVRLYDNFGGVVLDDEEGRRICAALGPTGRGVILQNHGILSVGQSVESTVAYFVRLEQLCETQLLADASGGSTVPLNEADQRDVFGKYGGEDEAWAQAQPMFDAIEREWGHEYKL